MLRGFFGDLIFAIIARTLCGNHLNLPIVGGVFVAFYVVLGRLGHFGCLCQRFFFFLCIDLVRCGSLWAVVDGSLF